MMNLYIRPAREEDLGLLEPLDSHVAPGELRWLQRQGRLLLAWEGEELRGFARWNLFWDNRPFLNLLYVLEPWRNLGVGSALLAAFEEQARQGNFSQVLTSTLSSEEAQHFYRHRGYVDCGALLLPGEALELIFRKELS